MMTSRVYATRYISPKQQQTRHFLVTMADEAAFMSQLLQGLDDSFWSAVPSPDPSPIKQKKALPSPTPRTPTKSHQPAQTEQILSSTVFSADDHDIAAFLEGSDSWDLDADPFTPIKPALSSKVVTTTQVNRFAYFLNVSDWNSM